MASEDSQRRKATGAFDPKSPSSFFIQSTSFDTTPKPSIDGSTSHNSTPVLPFNVFVAEDGIGCNAEETSALMRVIDARDRHQQPEDDTTEEPAAAAAYPYSYIYSTKALCQAYRRELTVCLEKWEMRMENGGDESEAAAVQQDDRDRDVSSIELLKFTQTFYHLCETFLLDRDGEEEDVRSSAMLGNSNAGIVTAGTVRYLRHNHMKGMDAILDEIGGGIRMEQLMDIDQPEHYHLESSVSSMNTDAGMSPYWALLRKLVLRGCLDDAWAVLSRHSVCKRSSQILSNGTDGYIDPYVREDNEAFALIQALLLSAPIPGGRNEAYDDGLNQDEDHMDEDELLGGIPPDAYKQWDAYASLQDSEFDIRSILNLFKSWKRTVIEMLKTHIPLKKLIRRVPMLQTCIFDVIVNTKTCYQEDDTWAERLIAELIYIRPQISKEDVHIRASDHIEVCSASAGSVAEDVFKKHAETIMIQTMQGNAGQVIHALHKYGGGSSAALPATMTALLCNLLVDSGKIDINQLSVDIETELFLSASSAILSSFAMQNLNEVGVRLATQLLRPLIQPENTRVTATVSEMLCRHWPTSDAETSSLLNYCKDSVCYGSRRMLDACDSLSFSRSSHYEKIGDVEKSIYFLLRGIEYSSLLGSETRSDMVRTTSSFSGSMCFRRLIYICATSTEFVLDQIFQCFSSPVGSVDVAVLSKPLQAGRIIADTIVEDEVAHLVENDPSVLLLRNVINTGLNLVLEETGDAAKGIIACLEGRKDVDGSIIVLAHPGLYGYLLSCAYDILTAEETSGNLSSAKSSFDLKGMEVLFSRYTQYCTREKVDIHQDSASSLRCDITPEKMREALGKGLMRAFVAANAKISLVEQESKKDDSSIAEQHAEQLLGPSLM